MNVTGRILAVGTIGVLVLTACTNQPTQGDDPASGTAVRGAAGAGDPYYPSDGNGGYDVQHYQLDITYDPSNGMLRGTAKITAHSVKSLSRFNLDLAGLRVNSVTVDGEKARFRHRNTELAITPPEPTTRGERFSTTVRYAGKPGSLDTGSLGPSGWQRSASGGAFAVGQPHSAASWYPVNDTPREKATFELSARVPDGWQVVSNGVPTGKESADGWTTYHWAERNRIVSYLTTVAIGKWTIERDTLPDGTPVVNAYAPGTEDKKAMQDRLGEVVEFLSGKFGPYPQTAAGGIFLAEDIGFSLETQTRPTYTRSAGLTTLVHETAHEWYGNSVSLASWADICLNECVASYAQWLWAEAKESKNLDASYRDAIDRLSDDSSFWQRKLHDPGKGNEFDAVYDKGILAMHALRAKVGDDAFDAVLRQWPTKHRDANASWPQFERFVQRISGERLDGFFDAWFRGTEIPPDRHLYPGRLRS